MKYYPDNTTTRYTTHLPQSMSLHGRWAVALAEIHIPMTILHIPPKGEENFIDIITNIVTPGTEAIVDFTEDRSYIPPGVYRSIDMLLDVINEMPCVAGHLKFLYGRNGYITVACICEDCKNLEHSFLFAPILNKILGFTNSVGLVVRHEVSYTAPKLAGLTNRIPDMFFIYTDICEPYITGDVHAPLLRVVSFDASNNYTYGAVKIRSFSPPRYVPLLRTNFQTIDIDIRDEFGQPIPFEGGTLTVTLQFKRIG